MHRFERHIPSQLLEAYAMGKCGGRSATGVEAHVLECDQCCYRMVREAEFVAVITYVLRQASSSSLNPIASRNSARTPAGCPS